MPSVGQFDGGTVHGPVHCPLVIGSPASEPDNAGVNVGRCLLVCHVPLQSFLRQLEKGYVPPSCLHRLGVDITSLPEGKQ